MKKLLGTINNTYRALRLLSEPSMIDALYQQLEEKRGEEDFDEQKIKYDKNNVFFHRHYVVQVVN